MAIIRSRPQRDLSLGWPRWLDHNVARPFERTFTDCGIARLRGVLGDLQEVVVLPEATPRSDPSWFGFPLAVRPEPPHVSDVAMRASLTAAAATRHRDVAL